MSQSAKINLTFQARNAENKLQDYFIRDLTKHRFNEVLTFLEEHFLSEEIESVSRGFNKDPVALQDYMNQRRAIMEGNISLLCVQKETNDIVAVALQKKLVKGFKDKEVELKSQNMKDYARLHDYLDELYNIFEMHQEDTILHCSTLSVHKDYRGRGIARQILEAQKILIEHLNINVLTTYFTSKFMQTAALNLGYVEDLELFYEDCEKLDPGYSFPGITAKSCKMMSYRRQ